MSLFNKLRHDRAGGAMVAIGYAIITVSIIAGLTTMSMASSATAVNQRITMAASSSIREAIDTITAEINAVDTKDVPASVKALEGRSFEISESTAIQSKTTVEQARFNGTTIRLDLIMESTGRIKWERRGAATLELSGATGLADIVDGRVVWEYDLYESGGEDLVVAFWVPGVLTVYSPLADPHTTPPPPETIDISRDLSSGVATFTASVPLSACPSTHFLVLESRVQPPGQGWTAWTSSTAASGDVQAGQEASFEARAHCESSDQPNSPVLHASARIERSTQSITAPSVTIDETGPGIYTATSTANVAPGPGGEVFESIRVRVDGKAWSGWSAGTAITLSLSPGQTLDAQGRVRAVSADGSETGWVLSGVTALTIPST